jgi:hypothetical protein
LLFSSAKLANLALAMANVISLLYLTKEWKEWVFWFWNELVFCVRVRVVLYGNKKENIFNELTWCILNRRCWDGGSIGGEGPPLKST